ncbi:hypothetical protein JCM19992_21800 [Thermostilla marina]
MSSKALSSPTFTDQEQAQIVTDLLALRKSQIREFLARCDLPKSGTKEEIRGRVEEALKDGTLSIPSIVRFLDEVIPWGKQHVYLYQGPRSSIAGWRNKDWVKNLLKKHRLGRYLNAALPLVLPDEMKLSTIQHDGRRLRVAAVKKREWWERTPEYDSTTATEEGDAVELRAFVRRVARTLVAFEWDLVANTAFLQISQLPSGFRYEDVAKEFVDLVLGWLDINRFLIVDLRPAIKRLHELEEAGRGETRSHGINYRTLQGRRFEGRSASPADPLLGEAPIDAALGAIRKSGVGHLGNFYWLPNVEAPPANNPLEAEVHVIIIGQHNRINFPTPNGEQTVRYVLSRIRSHSSRASRPI